MDELKKEPLELHVCMGLNSCKNQGFSGKNHCAGKGDCATVAHPCHTLNECKGQGGCGLFGTSEEFCHPSENDCRYKGSCGSPILASRFIAQGPNKGRSVWQLARKRFEKRMKKQGKKYGSGPVSQKFGPTQTYLNLLYKTKGHDFSSCGQSGDRYCSYFFDKTTRATDALIRWTAFGTNSAIHMKKTLKNCKGKK